MVESPVYIIPPVQNQERHDHIVSQYMGPEEAPSLANKWMDKLTQHSHFLEKHLFLYFAVWVSTPLKQMMVQP